MSAVKSEVEALLKKLPDECTVEDVQYHLYILDKVQQGIATAEEHGALSQDDVEKRLHKWTTE